MTVVTIVLLAWAGIASGQAKPNVVLIVADDLGWADLGCYGSTFHKTPNLDRLATQSRRFTQAYAAGPVCSPTRSALMTGKHPARLGITDYLPGRPPRVTERMVGPSLPAGLALEEVTIAERFQEAGYATGSIGKWHLGGPGFEPTRQGFDTNVAGDASGTPYQYIAPFHRGNRSIPGLDDAPEGQYLTDRLAIEADKFLEANRSRPFFLYLPHFAVHLPMVAKADLVAKYPQWDGTPRGKQQNPTYAAMLESLDDAVGRVLATLDRLGLADNTVVVFTSDNGGLATLEGALTPATNNAPLREGKGWLYEGGLRVPMLVRWPGHIAPGVEPTPAWSADLVPTLLGLARLPVPEVDGVSLAPLLLEGKSLSPRALHWHYPHHSNQGGSPSGAIREGDWKLVRHDEVGRLELFDLSKDPGESINLADRESDKTRDLEAKLAAWRTAVGARMPVANPDYRPNPQAVDGSITLGAASAEVHGIMLRFEPLPHKNTLGYWVRPDDWLDWEFEVDRPGAFDVEALVGCGDGSGGSVVEFRVGAQPLRLTVPVTGGFQAFRPLNLGRITIEKAGRHRLEVRVKFKPGPAVMDLRRVRLVPAKD